MKKLVLFIFFIATQLGFSQFNYQKTWATYYFGDSSEIVDSALDNQGNVIVLGYLVVINGVDYSNYTTSGSYQPDLVNGNSGAFFLSKFSPQGNLLWGTYIFQNDDSNTTLYYDIKHLAIDNNNDIYLAGSTNEPTGIATINSFMPILPNLISPGPNGFDDNSSFIMKFSSTGDNKMWGTYFPGKITGLKIDNQNNLIFAGWTSYATHIATTGVYQENLILNTATNPSEYDNVNFFLEKFNSVGNRIVGTYLGVLQQTPFFDISLSFDEQNNIFLATETDTVANNSLLSTLSSIGSFQPSHSGDSDGLIMKINNDFTQKMWGTFFGGASYDTISSIYVYNNDVYVFGTTRSTGLGTAGTFTPTAPTNGYAKCFLAKFNTSGNRIWSTYLYGNNNLVSGDLKIVNNKIFVTGRTDSISNLASVGSYQTVYGGGGDVFFAQFNLDGTRNWCSYFGGSNRDFNAYDTKLLSSNESIFYITGTTASSDNITTVNAFQSQFSNYDINPINCFIAKFDSNPLSNNQFSNNKIILSPNPNNGIFNLKGNCDNLSKNLYLKIYDNIGREIIVKKIKILENNINLYFDFKDELQSGIYIAKLSDEINTTTIFKILVD